MSSNVWPSSGDRFVRCERITRSGTCITLASAARHAVHRAVQAVGRRDRRGVHRPLEVRHDVLGEHAADQANRGDPSDRRRRTRAISARKLGPSCGSATPPGRAGPVAGDGQRPARMDVERHAEDPMRVERAQEPGAAGDPGVRLRVVDVRADLAGAIHRLVAVRDRRVVDEPRACRWRDRAVQHAVRAAAILVDERVGEIARRPAARTVRLGAVLVGEHLERERARSVPAPR